MCLCTCKQCCALNKQTTNVSVTPTGKIATKLVSTEMDIERTGREWCGNQLLVYNGFYHVQLQHHEPIATYMFGFK